MKEIKDMYRESFEQFGDSAKSVLWPKGRQSERFKALTKNIQAQGNFSVLDFGCGLAHLKPFLDSNFHNVNYTGVDMVDEFLAHDKKKYPTCAFYHVDEFKKMNDKYDYCLASGVFNILYHPKIDNHIEQAMQILENLLSRSNIYVSSDFMTDRVDFRQEQTFHASPEALFHLATHRLSRRVIIDHSYLPFEFNLTAYKNDAIIRPENIYG